MRSTSATTRSPSRTKGIGKTLYVKDRAAWRRWLEKHHARAEEIWLVYYRKASGKPRIPYNDAVDEALCFGWIDSQAKPIDEDSWAQRFTPRRKGSPISPMNTERVRRLTKEGRMTKAGLDAIGKLPSTRVTVPGDIAAALKKDPEVWKHFRAFPSSYKRIRIGFIEGARKRPAVFKQRLAYFVRMTKQNKRFGMVQ